MRYTNYRGLAKVTAETALRFACMNLKKLAKWKKKNGLLPQKYYDILNQSIHVLNVIRKMVTSQLVRVTILSTV